jgi:ABC-type amino acid transport substrate-binding protein
VESGGSDHSRGGRIASGEYLRNKYPGLRLVFSASDSDSLRMVSFGETDVAIVDMASASYLVERDSIVNLRVAGSLEYEYQAAFGVRKDLPLLKQILDKSLAQIPPQTRAAFLTNGSACSKRLSIARNSSGW